jgi:hypothetical protein
MKIIGINAVCIFCSFGRALLMLSDFAQAKRRLIDAQRIDPENNAISNELKKVCKQKSIAKVEVLFVKWFSGKQN